MAKEVQTIAIEYSAGRLRNSMSGRRGFMEDKVQSRGRGPYR